MRKLIVAAGMMVLGATAASAQYAPWTKGVFPYEARHHRVCQEKAFRLHEFERRAASDGRINPRERRIMVDLRIDLDRTCGRFRWRG